MAIKLQLLRKEIENGMMIDTEASGIFVEYTDEVLSEKIGVLKKHIQRLESNESINMLNEIIAGL